MPLEDHPPVHIRLGAQRLAIQGYATSALHADYGINKSIMTNCELSRFASAFLNHQPSQSGQFVNRTITPTSRFFCYCFATMTDQLDKGGRRNGDGRSKGTSDAIGYSSDPVRTSVDTENTHR